MIKQMLEGLNNKQLDAVTAPLGPCLVIAGAGSGKTRVLTLRCLYLVNELNFDPAKILCISFTNKAANEMKQRLDKITSYNFKWITTFHGLCLKILREDIESLGYSKNFNILDEEDQITLLKEAYRNFEIDIKNMPYRLILNFIEKCKSYSFDESDIKNPINWKKLFINTEKECDLKIKIFKFYTHTCKSSNSLDFNDLLIFTNKLFCEFPQIASKWNEKFDYILIDEFQDTNDCQYDLIKKLIENKNNIFVVGDPDQMIYSWRGANQSIINNFAKVHNGCKVIIMDKNYRSNQPILNVANNLICMNNNRYQKDLFSDIIGESKPVYFNAENQDEESRWVVSRILKLINDNNISLNEVCILYRSNYLSRNIEQELMINNLPYIIHGGIRFYQRKEIKDVIAYLKTLFLMDEISIKRIINVPKRGVSMTSIDEISKFAKQHNISFAQALFSINDINISSIAKKGVKEFVEMLQSINHSNSLSEILSNVLDATKYIDYLKSINEFDRVKNIDELKASIIEYEQKNPNNSFIDYLQEISIFYDDHEQKNKNSISLMSIHSSKGLEFKYVFIIGLNEGVFPSRKSIENLENLQEERRIAYVAITRAKEQLFLSSFGGFDYINNHYNKPSRFVGEIDLSLLTTDSLKIKSLNKVDDGWFDSTKKKNYKENYNTGAKENFRIGDRVIHTAFGEGIILKVNGDILDISFKPPFNNKTIVANHKSLKRKIAIN